MPAGALLAAVEHIRPHWLEKEFRHSVLAFGAGALLSAVALVLVPEGIKHQAVVPAALWFVAGGFGFVPQGRMIFSSMTVKENIETGLTTTKKRSVPQELYDMFPVLLEMRNRRGGNLSGGQQQRVFLARALAQEAELIVMDEPFVGIDMASQESILSIVQKLRDSGKTVIIVHHDLSVVARYFDDVVLLNKKLIANGPIDEILKSENIEKAYGMTLLLNKQ